MSINLSITKQRNRLIQLTKEQLIGKKFKDDILVGKKPLNRFFTGFLFPIVENLTGIEEVSVDEDVELKDDEV